MLCETYYYDGSNLHYLMYSLYHLINKKTAETFDIDVIQDKAPWGKKRGKWWDLIIGCVSKVSVEVPFIGVLFLLVVGVLCDLSLSLSNYYTILRC
jgi:hypothetical protein